MLRFHWFFRLPVFASPSLALDTFFLFFLHLSFWIAFGLSKFLLKTFLNWFFHGCPLVVHIPVARELAATASIPTARLILPWCSQGVLPMMGTKGTKMRGKMETDGNRRKPTETEKLVNCLQCRLCSFLISERCSKSQ